jgi:hypothetical protein
MRTVAVVVSAIVVFVLSSGSAHAWSIRDEVVAIDPNLTVELVWELIDSKIYCQSEPTNLDRLSCAIVPDPAEFWIGLDAAGNRYGTINGVDAAGDYFDIYRRPAGTKQSEHIVRITKRKEPFFGEVTKLQVTSGWEIDQTGGTLLIGLTGSCFSAACTAQGDTTDHLAVIRITGLPTLFDLALSYEAPAGLSIRMPVRPEALPSADRIDVYYGAAASLADLSSALSLACDVAGSAGPGDTVSVADPLPDPGPGEARYYLAAVTSGLDRRAGRQRANGALQGRHAADLPACP